MNVVLFLSSFIAGAFCVYLYFKKYRGSTLKPSQEENHQEMVREIDMDVKKQTTPTVPQEELSIPSTSQLQKTLDDLYIVNELGQNITSSLNLQETFSLLLTTLNSMMDAAVIELRVLHATTQSWKLFTSLKLSEEEKEQNYNNLAQWCSDNKREILLTDAEQDFERYVFRPLILPDGRMAKSVLVFPILDNGKVSGTLCIISFQKNTYNEYHQKIIRLLLGYISIAMQNAITHEELNITKLRAERSEKFMQQFLANMSHEIRTPINAVTGMSRLLLEKSPRSEQISYLDSIHNASNSLLVIINDILDLSKIEAGKIELEHIEFSPADLLHQIKEIMQFKAEEKGLTLLVDIEKSIPPVLIGDPTRLIQILNNLTGNAIKFTEKGRVSIWLKTAKVHKRNSEEDNEPKRCAIRFEIQDTGIGMTQEQQTKLFQDYVQASAETTRKYGGTGLGLSISKQLVQLQGGNIDVKSELGKGSTFSFELEYLVSENIQVNRKEQIVSEQMLEELNGIRVLLADDNEYNRIIARETLQLRIPDIMVDEALDGEMAIAMIKKNLYDIILMDLIMPKLDGFEATRFIRTELSLPKNKIPVLALTASVVKSEIDKSREAGMNGFIPKPFKSSELIIAIYQALHGQVQSTIVEQPIVSSITVLKGNRIHRDYLEEYAEGDSVRIQRFIDLFLLKTPDGLTKLKNALNNLDYEAIRITAHSLKPQFQSVGLLEGVDILNTMELFAIEKKHAEQMPAMITQLGHLFEEASKDLHIA